MTLSSSSPINPDYSFENLVMGPGNRLAHAAAVAVAANPGQAYNPLFIYGGRGTGKTHILQAICQRLLESDSKLNVEYLSGEEFVTQFMEAVQSGQMAEFRKRFRGPDVLVIDGIDVLARRERTQEEFLHTFNSLYQAQKQIVLSSDTAPEAIPDLDERLASRFKWGLVTKIETPGFEERVAGLQVMARLRGLDLPANVATFIAGHVTGTYPDLTAALVKIQLIAGLEKKPIDLIFAKKAIYSEKIQPRDGGGEHGPSGSNLGSTPAEESSPTRTLEEVERDVIISTLEKFGGNRWKTAKALGIGVRTLGLKLKRWKERGVFSETAPASTPSLVVYVQADDGDEDDIAEMLVALSDMHRAAGGLGLTFTGEEVRVLAACEVPA